MTMGLSEELVVVTPIYEDNDASSQLFQGLSHTFDKKVFIIAVDDGSVREPVDIKSIESVGLNGVVIKLKRNVGHQRAISIGLAYAAEHIDESQRIIVMDSDGEDTPESINELLVPLNDEKTDIVVAQRRSRVESFKFKAFYIIYKWLFNILAGKKISFGNFMAMKIPAVKRLVAMQELGTHVASTVLSSRLRVEPVLLDRGPRYAGKSKMNFVGLVLHGFKGLMVFAEDVLVRVGIASAIVAVLSIIGGATAIILKVSGFATPGWFSVALGILLLVFLQTGTMTLMILMLTGVVKGSTVVGIDYKTFIDKIEHANS